MKSFMGGGVIGTAVGGMALGVMLVRRRRASSRFASQSAPPKRREGLEELAKEELYERARRANIAGRSRMTKDGLIQALRATT